MPQISDAAGFHSLTVAVVDDYFEGTSSGERVERHFATPNNSASAICVATPQLAVREENFWSRPQRDPQLYVPFMSELVQHHRGRVHSWEIWNERDNNDYWRVYLPQLAELIMLSATAIRSDTTDDCFKPPAPGTSAGSPLFLSLCAGFMGVLQSRQNAGFVRNFESR